MNAMKGPAERRCKAVAALGGDIISCRPSLVEDGVKICEGVDKLNALRLDVNGQRIVVVMRDYHGLGLHPVD